MMQVKLLLPLLFVSVYGAHHVRQERIRSLSDMVSYPDVQESYFRTNKLYTFQYDGQVNIGVPDHSDQQSASRIQAEVTLVKRSDEHFILRIRNARIAKSLNRIEDPRQIQPIDQFEQNELSPREKSTLEMPVEFTYADGQIQDLVFQQQDEDWSANMKRGVINMLQIKLQPKDRVSMEEEQSALNKLDTESKTDIAQVYRTNEKTVEGQCDTMYSVNTIQDHNDQSSSTMIVTKTIDLNSCQQRPQIRTNFQFIQMCPRCQQMPENKDKFVQSSTVLRYQIRGKRDKFLVESVQMSNDHVYAPQNKDENTVMVTIRANLRLVNSQDASQHSMELSDYPQTGQKVSDLIYTSETEQQLIRFQTKGDQHFPAQLENHPSNEQSKVAAFGEILNQIVRHMRSSIDEKANRMLYKAIALARMMKESEIKSIHTQYFTRHQSSQMTPEEREKARNILPHIYAQAGTLNAIRHLSDSIKNKEISAIKAAVIIPSLMNAAHVSKEMIMEMVRLEQSSAVQQNEMLKNGVWLTIGSMMRTACRQQSQSSISTGSSQEEISSCSSDTEQRFARIISEKLRSGSNWEEKILFLRVLGNAGLDSSIQDIERILTNKQESQSSTLRLEAIMALRNLRQSLPQKTKSILLATSLNKLESSAVRMAAIQQLIQDNPGKLIIDQLISMINHDQDRRVASFAYRLMKSISQSNQPCYSEMNHNLRAAIKRVKRISASMPASDVIFESMQDMEKKMGVDFFLLPMYNSDEIVPKFIRVGINQINRNRRIKNLLAMELGSSGLSSIFSDFLETIPERQAGSSQYKFNVRRFVNGMQRHGGKPKSWMSLKVKNQDVLLYTMDEQQLKQIMQSDSTQIIASILSSLRSMSRSTSIDEATLLHETTIKLPTAIGTQLRIKTKIPAILSIHGQVRSEMQGLGQGRMNVHGKLNAIVSFVTDVSSTTPIQTNGIYLIRTAKASVPIDVSISVDPTQPEEQLKVEIRHSEASRDIIKLESRPVIYSKRSMKPMTESEEKTIVADKNTKMESFKNCMQIPAFGSELCVRGLTSEPSCQHSKLMHYLSPWFGPNKVVLSVYPTSSGEKQVTLSGSIKRTPSSRGEEDDSYRFTLKSRSNVQSVDIQMTKSSQSIVPKQIKARYSQSSAGQSNLEVCMHMTAKDSTEDRSQSERQRSSEPRRINIDTKFNWGSQCQPENYIQAQVETIYRQRLYRDQSKARSLFDEETSSSLMTSRDETSGYKVKVSHSNVPRYISDYGEKILDFLVYSNYWNSKIKRSSNLSSRRQGHESIQMNMKSNGKADIRIQTSRKTVTLENVRIPAAFRNEKMGPSNLVRLTGILLNSQSKSSCQIQENSINTFDNAVYRIPFSSCYTILAKDIASRFTVSAKHSKSHPGRKTVKITTPEHEIKLKPEQGSTSVYLDGNRWQEDTFTDQRSIKISRSGQQVSVKLVKPSVQISFSGEFINIQAPQRSHAQLQGMCGNLNADASDDFGEWSSSDRKNIQQLWQEMTQSDGSCQQPTEQSQNEFDHQIPYEQSDELEQSRRQVWNRDDSEEQSSQHDDDMDSNSDDWDNRGSSRRSSGSLEIEDVLTEVAPIRQNKIVERHGQRCISIRPIERCPDHSYVADQRQVQREVQYTCLSRQDPLISQISQRRRQGQSMDLADREVSFSRTEMMPSKCIAIV